MKGSEGNELDSIKMGKFDFSTDNIYAVALNILDAGPVFLGKHNLFGYLNITNLSSDAYLDFTLAYQNKDLRIKNKRKPIFIDESTLKIYQYGNGWLALNSTVDFRNNLVYSGMINEFSLFSLFGDEFSRLKPRKVMKLKRNFRRFG